MFRLNTFIAMIAWDVKSILSSIILSALLFLCVLFLINREKIYKIIEPFVEKYIPVILLYPIFLFILLVCIDLISIEDYLSDQFNISAIIIYLLFVAIVIIGLIEKFGQYISESLTFPKLILYIILSLFSVVLCFGFAFNALFFFDGNMFTNVSGNGYFEQAIQFVYYSFGIMFSTEICDIKAISLISQGVVIAESLSSFIVIVILLANYENIGRIFNQNTIKNN